MCGHVGVRDADLKYRTSEPQRGAGRKHHQQSSGIDRVSGGNGNSFGDRDRYRACSVPVVPEWTAPFGSDVAAAGDKRGDRGRGELSVLRFERMPLCVFGSRLVAGS